jgi:pyruvate dehydrogenase E1 component alpha subunit
VNLSAEDYLVTTYRGIHDQLAKGMPLKELFAEYGGRLTGSCKGKGGPMHITYPRQGIMVTTGIVGSGIPIANGLALAAQMRGDNRVTVCNFGDGATNIGAFHEALNLAAVWRLPVIFICQNNLYAESTSLEDGTAITNISQRAASYGIPGVQVDGNDALAMYGAAKRAVDRARGGAGPTLIEARTFRLMGHYFGDPSTYIPKEELKAAVAAEPVPLLRAALIDRGVTQVRALDEFDQRIREELDEAVAYMKDSDFPGVDEMRRDVFSKEVAA